MLDSVGCLWTFLWSEKRLICGVEKIPICVGEKWRIRETSRWIRAHRNLRESADIYKYIYICVCVNMHLYILIYCWRTGRFHVGFCGVGLSGIGWECGCFWTCDAARRWCLAHINEACRWFWQHVYKHVYIYTYYTYIFMYIYTYIHTYIYKFIYIYIYTHILYIYIHIYINTRRPPSWETGRTRGAERKKELPILQETIIYLNKGTVCERESETEGVKKGHPQMKSNCVMYLCAGCVL